jgi:lysophospholipid acyltransferase (LPLAT)-like uncharacterized protein
LTTQPKGLPETDDAVRRFTVGERIKLSLISVFGYLLIRVIGATLRYEISAETEEGMNEPAHPGIFAFWHRCVIPAAYRWQNQKFAVLTSRSFDGEYIARIIRRFGHEAVRGSSSRGGAEGLLELQRVVEQGRSAVFTIDGPRGPVYVAKRGAVALSRMTGVRVVPFYIAVEKHWTLHSWDRMMVPKPFSRAHVRAGAAIHVPQGADQQTFDRCQAELQAALERVRDYAEAKFGRKASNT